MSNKIYNYRLHGVGIRIIWEVSDRKSIWVTIIKMYLVNS